MKHLVLVALVAFGLSFAPVASADGPFRNITFDQAREAAAKEGKIVLVDFYTTWCAPCKALDQKTWPDPAVVTWLTEKTIALKIDAEKEVALAERYRIGAYPTILLVKADGTEIDRITGFRSAVTLLGEMNDAIAGRDAIARAKAKLTGAAANDPMARMDYADALAKKGRYEEALAEYLWCYDHGTEHDPAFVGVRSSFLLGAIQQLGHRFEPAHAALRARRDSATTSLQTGAPSAQLAVDVVMLNMALGERERTLATYDALGKSGDVASEAREAILYFAADDFLAARRYGDVLASVDDALAAFDRHAKLTEEVIAEDAAAAKASPTAEEAEMAAAIREYRKNDTRRTGARLYEALLGAGRDAEAAKLLDRILAFDASADLYAALISGAKRAGKPAAAEGIAKRALANLPKEEHAVIQDALR